jgi:hypothetical protein
MVASPLVAFPSDWHDVVDFDFVEELETVFASVEADTVACPISC